MFTYSSKWLLQCSLICVWITLWIQCGRSVHSQYVCKSPSCFVLGTEISSPVQAPGLRCLDSFIGFGAIYTVNHKKRGSIFLTITLANLNRFL